MKVLLIHGQSHKGSTYHMGRIMAEKLTNPEEIEEYFLPTALNHFCLGCFSCVENEEKCPFWGEKKLILEALQRADVFIFTTPNYCLAPSGAMKSFLDMFFDIWMVHRPKEWMFSKQAVIISSSAGASCRNALKVVKGSLFYWGIPKIYTYGVALAANRWNMVSDKKLRKIDKKTDQMKKKIKLSKPNVGLKTKIIFRSMGLMHKKGWDASRVEGEYWRERGWLAKNRPWK